jgi:hypothetical protein
MSRTRLAWATLLASARLAGAQPAPEAPPAPAPAPPAPADPAPAPTPAAAPAPTPAPVDPAPAVVTPAVEPVAPPAQDTWHFNPGAFIQPQFRIRQKAPGAPNDTDGFRFARARIFGSATTKAGNLDLSAYFESEMQPSFQMIFAFVTAARAFENGSKVTLDVGQTRVPISRQNLLSDTMLSFVDKAQVATIAPDHDLGARLWYVLPGGRVRAVASMFNGEGRDQVQNINDSFLYAGRVEVTPFGKDPMRESAFDGDFLTIAGSVGHNRLSPGNKYSEIVTYYGGDVAGAWHGISGEFEYLWVHDEDQGKPANLPDPSHYNANGWNAQLAYLLPWGLPPYRTGRLELAARVEEIDRNDAVPIVMIGDPNQSVREYTAVVSYYLRKHLIKAQLAASHYTEIEDLTVTGQNASYPNDQLLLQLTYRVE